MKLISIIVVLLLGACSQAPDEAVKKEIKPTKTLSKDNVFKGYKDDINKAKAMEKEVLKAAEKQRKAIDG